jgi:tRNA(adenine34) deaminase
MIDKEKWMNIALDEAYKAEDLGEVPVGAVVLGPNGELISKAHNLKEQNHDPCGHAEILALKKAAEVLGSWRLTGCWLFVTLEPCMMCTGSIIQSRIENLVFGAADPKSGFVTSTAKGLDEFKLNHHPKWEGGIEAEKCSTVLKKFFKLRRYDKRNP